MCTQSTILETKYAFARNILDKVLAKKNDRQLFQNNLRCEVVETMKTVLSSRFAAEAKLYNLETRADKHFIDSKREAARNNRWREDVKIIDMDTTRATWDVNNAESFVVPPLTIGTWVAVHMKYDMSVYGYALPLYSLYGIDVLQSVLDDVAARYTSAEESISLEMENVQNQTFFKLGVTGKLIIVWMDSVNLPSMWCTAEEKPILGRCYVMTRGIETSPLQFVPDPFLDLVVEALVNGNMILYSPNMPYDLKPFPNILAVEESTLEFRPADLWRQIINVDSKFYVLAQQLPRTYSSVGMTAQKLLFWLSLDKIPSNMLLRIVTNANKRSIKTDRTSLKLICIMSKEQKVVKIFDLTVKEQPVLSGLGPLMPPIVLAQANFETYMDARVILQPMVYLGIFRGVIFTDKAIKPVFSKIEQGQFADLMATTKTIATGQLNKTFNSYFAQEEATPETIVGMKAVRLVRFVYSDLVCYTFLGNVHEEVQFDLYDTVFRLMMKNKQLIFSKHRNLGITLAHFMDLYNSLIK